MFSFKKILGFLAAAKVIDAMDRENRRLDYEAEMDEVQREREDLEWELEHPGSSFQSRQDIQDRLYDLDERERDLEWEYGADDF